MSKIGLVFISSGEIMLAVMILLTHHKVIKERNIDQKVITEFRREQIFGVLAIILITVGTVIDLFS